MKKRNEDKLKLYFTEESDQLASIRTNWFSDFILQNINVNEQHAKDKKILDVGCGNGKLLYNLKKRGFQHVYGCDYSHVSKKMSNAMKGYQTIDLNRDSLTSLYGKESFDLVCCTEVLEHLFDPERTIIEMIEITKRNGYIFISVPLDINILARIKYLFGQGISAPFSVGTHIKFFKPHMILDKLRQHELEIVKLKYLGLGYGVLDQKIQSITGILARTMPSLFSSDMMILLKKK